LAGKPTIAIHPGSMAWDVTKRSITDYKTKFTPDRAQWVSNFAYTQWLAEEIASGEALTHILQGINL
jgi:hypothetical protein